LELAAVAGDLGQVTALIHRSSLKASKESRAYTNLLKLYWIAYKQCQNRKKPAIEKSITNCLV
jgi:hypothetical protein